MPKANTRWVGRGHRAIPSFLRFSHLRARASLAWQVRLLLAGISSTSGEIPNLKMDGQGVHMFDGKNNQILDSFSFRVAMTAAVFAVWSAAGYVLLYLA